jgi:hypothetical protein
MAWATKVGQYAGHRYCITGPLRQCQPYLEGVNILEYTILSTFMTICICNNMISLHQNDIIVVDITPQWFLKIIHFLSGYNNEDNIHHLWKSTFKVLVL